MAQLLDFRLRDKWHSKTLLTLAVVVARSVGAREFKSFGELNYVLALSFYGWYVDE